MNPTSVNSINPDITSEKNISFWTSTTQPIIYEKLNKKLDTDILIIGGGIAGLTTAYCLASSGRKVVVVEDGYLGSGESGRTTAHITYALDDRYAEIENKFGKEKAMLAANSHMTALQWIDITVRNERIDCNFKRVPGYLFLHNSDKIETLEKEFQSTRRLGLMTEVLPAVPGIEELTEKKCLKFPGQGQFHILKYLRGLSEAIIRKGGKIYTETKAEEITKEGAKANGFAVRANHIVVATNTPVNDIVTMHSKQHPYRTYVIGATIPRNHLPYSLWWDTGDQQSSWIIKPYHYVRLEEFDNKYDLLIAGGEDHKLGQSEKEDIPEERRFDNLIAWTRKLFPAIEHIGYKWSGQVMEPLDSMAFIGRNPGDENIYIITGDSGNGMTHATLGGILIADIISGKKNMWEEIYHPSRKVNAEGNSYDIPAHGSQFTTEGKVMNSSASPD